MRQRGLQGHGHILTILCCSELVLAIDVTIVTIANPDIEKSLGFTAATLQWTLTAYALTFGGFLLLGGRLTDLYGRRRLFVGGMAAFTLASLGAAASASSVELVACRAAQGLAAAVIAPAALAILASTFREGRLRDRAYAIWATAGSLGGMIGFLLGGVLTSAFGWRSIFLINGPIGVVAIIGALAWLPEEEGTTGSRQLDLPGAVTVTAGVGLLIFGVSQAESAGWASPSVIGSLAGSVALIGLFLLIERHSRQPLLPLRLLRRRGAIANVSLALLGTISTAALFLSALYMQQVFAYSAGKAGAATLSLPAGYAIGANLGSRALNRIGARRLAASGFVLLAASLLWLDRIPTHGRYVTTFLPALLVLGTGLGMALVPSIVTATAGVGPDDHGVAAGLCTMSQQMGGAIGLAALATIAASGVAGVGHAVAETEGIRLAYLVAMGISVGGAFLVGFGLPDSQPYGDNTIGEPVTAVVAG
ncbi:MAG TPA: MFS transporter [Acidimicrobiales bacterium]